MHHIFWHGKSVINNVNRQFCSAGTVIYLTLFLSYYHCLFDYEGNIKP